MGIVAASVWQVESILPGVGRDTEDDALPEDVPLVVQRESVGSDLLLYCAL